MDGWKTILSFWGPAHFYGRTASFGDTYVKINQQKNLQNLFFRNKSTGPHHRKERLTIYFIRHAQLELSNFFPSSVLLVSDRLRSGKRKGWDFTKFNLNRVVDLALNQSQTLTLETSSFFFFTLAPFGRNV